MSALAHAHDASQRRIQELEQQVSELQAIVACIPMAAAALSLLPPDQFSVTIKSPAKSMELLEVMAVAAERWHAYLDHIQTNCAPHMMDAVKRASAGYVSSRRERIERELPGIFHLTQQS